jgi:hypothetical protein
MEGKIHPDRADSDYLRRAARDQRFAPKARS